MTPKYTLKKSTKKAQKQLVTAQVLKSEIQKFIGNTKLNQFAVYVMTDSISFSCSGEF